jgi:AcrR family transcriptional regulator
MSAQTERVAPGAADEDSSKRRQIVEGARQVFMAQGFDAASMGEIARVAGVSKGTLYVYFKDKEELFEAIVGQECKAHGEQIFDFDANDHDVEGVLTRLGIAYVQFLCRPGGASPLRTVIAIAERMPEVGRRFYETGPAFGIAQLASYLRSQVAAGVLEVEDCEVAAAQFMDACLATVFRPILFNFGTAPAPERIEYVVKIAVRVFLAAYRAR